MKKTTISAQKKLKESIVYQMVILLPFDWGKKGGIGVSYTSTIHSGMHCVLLLVAYFSVAF